MSCTGASLYTSLPPLALFSGDELYGREPVQLVTSLLRRSFDRESLEPPTASRSYFSVVLCTFLPPDPDSDRVGGVKDWIVTRRFGSVRLELRVKAIEPTLRRLISRIRLPSCHLLLTFYHPQLRCISSESTLIFNARARRYLSSFSYYTQ
ncbi:hypothetical protein BDQ17DRAFT_879187 [Cyathus striatus]|nr:hypothetical protein BDQ17DRAFT_879187 [Cyathus striatus]